ncbi:hypothetical protein SI65_01332 [Aspergillus cristatus]|uniref:BZIP domain-containing protein n=1 Tax=Aspergillus cristatus TaxID=573508 RepID=A0A1E3BRZ1_ASPCR|nr:hypothetical protein SI65_01332 [Aspergillus cristatus]
MEPATDQKKEKLARIRENQRKSRARKQEYTRELEQQLASFKEKAHQKDVEHRLTVQRLEAENARLKSLLAAVGVPSSVVHGYLQATGESEMARKVAIPALKRAEGAQGQGARSCSLKKEMSGNAVCCAKPDGLVSIGEPVVSPDNGTDMARQSVSLRSRICGSVADDRSFPTNEDVLNTTLCAIAEELINQYNTRGVDLAEIQKKLWAGFTRSCATGEECRVQNHILFQVLDEISGD